MHFKKVLSKTLSAVSILGLSSMLLELSFINPSLAMEESEDGVSEFSTLRAGSSFISSSLAVEEIDSLNASSHNASLFFDYDLKHITKAQQLINEATFLSENIRLFFNKSIKTYDRTQLNNLFFEEDDFLSTLMPPPTLPEIGNELQLNPMPLQHRRDTEDEDTEERTRWTEFEELRVQALQQARAAMLVHHRELQIQLYGPYIKNMSHEINMKGPLNYQLFDSFFAHLLGVGKLWWVKKEQGFDIVVNKQEKYVYDREDVIDLLHKLQGIGFLKNFTKHSLASVESFYTPSNQLKRFHENNKEKITQLVIAGGHLGYTGIESISKYRNALTIDLSPLELPDIIADINNKELLEELVRNYEGKLDFIIDTSCCGFVFDEDETAPSLLKLLRPGGHLISRRPTGFDIIDSDLADTYVKKYNLKPVFSDSFGNNNQPNIAALEKQ